MKNYALLILLAFVSCSNPDSNPLGTGQEYFELKAYFEKEALRLQKANPTVDKTVVANGKAERRRLKLRSWTKEFSSFIDADINKRAWAGEFVKKVNDSSETYLAQNEKVPVKSVKILRSNKQVTGIEIIIKNENYLYTSTDTLSYYPDKRYEVRKTQQIKLMNKKQYRITGIF
jgi:hypothetical protein